MSIPQAVDFIPPTNELDISGHLQEFRVEIVKRTALALLLITGTASWLLLPLDPFPVFTFLVMIVVFALALFIRRIAADHPTRSRYLMLALAITGPITLMLVSRESWLPFSVLPFVFIGSLMVDRGELILAGTLLAATGLLNWLGLRAYPLYGFLTALALTVALSWVLIYMINTSLEWYQAMLDQSNRLLHETRDHRGELSRVVKALKLATDLQRRTEQELIEARRSADEARLMKERFAARVSHELRTPMALIHGFSEVMYTSPEIYGDVTWTPTMRRDIAQIYRSSRHMLAMIDDILNLSRFEMAGFAMNLEDTSITTLAHETAAIAADLFNNPAVRFETDIPDDLPTLKIDRTRIRQVILNLINNARRFTEAGFVRLSVSQNPHEILISVSDTGPGIPADKLDLIFQEFYQVDETVLRNKGGTGLGLTICKNFVEIHGGHIWAESELGKGSHFLFSLPRSSPFIASLPLDSEPVDEQAEQSARIVVTGADEYVMAMLRSTLGEYEIIPVENAGLLEQSILLYHPRAIFVNAMPGADTGLIDHANLAVPVIHFSLPSARWLVERLGIHACMAKPVTSEQLQREIERVGNINKILVIDDDTNFSQLIERMLQSYNPDLEIITASSGRGGLNMAALRRPDVILLDLSMPDVDGFYVIEHLKATPALSAIPIILLTANLHPERMITWTDNRVLIQRRGELRVAETVDLLKAALSVLKPNYSESTDDILNKLKL